MQRFWIILLVFALGIPALAQEDTAAAAFERLVPSNVRLRLNAETGTAALVFNASPAVCEPLVIDITVEGAVIDVDTYVPLSAQGATCNFIAPYEPIIELGELPTDVTYALLLNDFATTFFLPQVGGIVMDMPAATIWGEDNVLYPFSRVDSYINSIETTVIDSTVGLNLSGSHPDGCISQEFQWLRHDETDPNIYHIEVFRLIPEGVMCPMELQDFSLELNTGLAAAESFYFEAGDNWLAYSPSATTALINLPITIDTVTIIPNADKYQVTVNGSLLDCGVDLSQAQISKAYASFISLSMIFPLDNSCSNEANPYEGLFMVDILPVIINGIAYTENGVLSPNNQAQAPRPENPVGDNFMAVDTVIESVDVLILESFPMQLDLVVKGYQPDGCDFPVMVEQSREGNVVTVHVYRQVPLDVMCTMMIVPYEATIRLDGGFEGGSFEIHVNEFTTTVDL